VHRLLTPLVLVALVLATSLVLVTPAGGSHANGGRTVFLYLYHPTGDLWRAATLACGWHDNCDGNPNADPRKDGLDWVWPDQSATVYLRIKGVSEVTGLVAKGYTYFTDHGVGCPEVVARVRRVDSDASVAWIHHYHARLGAPAYFDLYGGSGSAWLNQTVTGYIGSHQDDNCSGYDHVMQKLEMGPAGQGESKNSSGLPDEAQCNNWSSPPCRRPYGIWETVERIIFFIS